METTEKMALPLQGSVTTWPRRAGYSRRRSPLKSGGKAKEEVWGTKVPSGVQWQSPADALFHKQTLIFGRPWNAGTDDCSYFLELNVCLKLH